jgi:hypothetical protein
MTNLFPVSKEIEAFAALLTEAQVCLLDTKKATARQVTENLLEAVQQFADGDLQGCLKSLNQATRKEPRPVLPPELQDPNIFENYRKILMNREGRHRVSLMPVTGFAARELADAVAFVLGTHGENSRIMYRARTFACFLLIACESVLAGDVAGGERFLANHLDIMKALAGK